MVLLGMRTAIGVLLMIMGENWSGGYAMREWVHRNPKYLPFPMGLGNKLQIISGFGIPVQLERDSLTFGIIVKTNFALPTNATQFTNPQEAFADFSKKQMRGSLYKALINVFERLSFGGRDCLLRCICEAAHTPVFHNGVLGELLHIILTPSTTADELSSDYKRAEQLGTYSESFDGCSTVYHNCSLSFLDIISKVEHMEINNSLLKAFEWLK